MQTNECKQTNANKPMQTNKCKQTNTNKQTNKQTNPFDNFEWQKKHFPFTYKI